MQTFQERLSIPPVRGLILGVIAILAGTLVTYSVFQVFGWNEPGEPVFRISSIVGMVITTLLLFWLNSLVVHYNSDGITTKSAVFGMNNTDIKWAQIASAEVLTDVGFLAAWKNRPSNRVLTLGQPKAVKYLLRDGKAVTIGVKNLPRLREVLAAHNLAV